MLKVRTTAHKKVTGGNKEANYEDRMAPVIKVGRHMWSGATSHSPSKEMDKPVVMRHWPSEDVDKLVRLSFFYITYYD